MAKSNDQTGSVEIINIELTREFIAEEFPLYKHQLYYISDGLSKQKRFVTYYSKNSILFYRCLQVLILISSAIATVIIGLYHAKVALIFTTATLILTGATAFFDPRSLHIRHEQARRGFSELQDEITYTMSKDIDGRSNEQSVPLVNEKLIGEWHEQLSTILGILHDDRIKSLSDQSKE